MWNIEFFCREMIPPTNIRWIFADSKSACRYRQWVSARVTVEFMPHFTLSIDEIKITVISSFVRIGPMKMDNADNYDVIVIVKNKPHPLRGCPRGVIVKAVDRGIVVSEFEIPSLYYNPFRTNTVGKGMNPLILFAID